MFPVPICPSDYLGCLRIPYKLQHPSRTLAGLIYGVRQPQKLPDVDCTDLDIRICMRHGCYLVSRCLRGITRSAYGVTMYMFVFNTTS